MISIYRIFLKSLFGLINILFILQIAIMVLVFLTSMYWFCDLIGTDWFMFAKDLAIAISELVKQVYSKDILIGGVFVDSSLLLFDIVAIILVILITKSKFYIYKLINFINNQINTCKQKREDDFNKNLEKELVREIFKSNKVLLLLKIEVKSLADSSIWGKTSDDIISKKLIEAYDTIKSALEKVQYCRVSKSSKLIGISLDKFDNIDKLICFIQTLSKNLKNKLRGEGFILNTFCAVDVFEDGKLNFKYIRKIEKLLKLRQKNEILCLKSFSLRYELNSDKMYFTTVQKGTYAIDDDQKVYALVKKS